MNRMKENKYLVRIIIAAMDALLLAASYAAAIWVRFDFCFRDIPSEIKTQWVMYIPWLILITIAVFAVFHMYRYVWHIVGLRDVMVMVASVMIAFFVSQLVLFPFGLRIPVAIRVIALFLQLILLVGMRTGVRVYSEIANYMHRRNAASAERVMLIGGGSAGRAIVREYAMSDRTKGKICCIIDDNSSKRGKQIEGIPIVGGRYEIERQVKTRRITLILFAIPTASPRERREILRICSKTGIATKTLPGIFQLVNGQAGVSDMKDVQIEDLLGRDSVLLDMHRIKGNLKGKVIAVTGGGGSIGSELCRQIAAYAPRTLLIVDIYENNAYEIQQELIARYAGSIDLHVEIASVRDSDKIEMLFKKYRPEIVFHAAAHKHVPLMESVPTEAIKNNIFGTYNVANAAEHCGVRKFVLISTDKAVNPTNVMGATKRFCEMIMQSRYDSKTEFCAVRFGNVLGSNGSVVPLFKKQIAQGGPVTVTDVRITRFFMTIPEAAQLVLEAQAMAKQSQIFVLDMGEPVRIIDLAENLIRLSGLEPYEDIDIEEIGLRPGEKLYEELLMASNALSATSNSKIFVEQQGIIDRETIDTYLASFGRRWITTLMTGNWSSF